MVTKIGLLSCLLGLICSTLKGQAGLAPQGPRFDPTPIEIPQVTKAQLRPITSLDLVSIRDIHGLQISPDGKSIAFVVGQALLDTNSYRSGLFVISTDPGSLPVSLGSAGPGRWNFGGEWAPEKPQWSPDSRYITYRMNTSGTWQVWRWDRTGGSPVQVTHCPDDVVIYSWATSKTEIVFVSKKRIDPTIAVNLQERGILYDGTTYAWQNRSIVDQVLERRPVETEQWILDTVSGQERKRTAEEVAAAEDWKKLLGESVYDRREALSGRRGSIFYPKLSPDGTKVVYKRYLMDANKSVYTTVGLCVRPLNGSPEITLRAESYRFTDYEWSRDSQQIFFTEKSGSGHSPGLYVVPASGGIPQQLAGSNISGWLDEYSLDSAAAHAACIYENNTTPGEIAVLDLKTAKRTVLTDLNPEFRNLELSPASRIEWTNKYGDKGHAYLVKPLGYEKGKHYPLIVTTYSSGDYFLRGGVGDEYPIQLFAANGFAVLAFDNERERNIRTGDFRDALLHWTSPLAGLEAALKILGDTGDVDLNRVGITGLSYGSEIVDFAISQSNLFRAAIASGGGSRDPYFYYMAGSSWHRQFADWGLGGWPEGASSENWHQLSPALNANRVNVPLLVNAAETEYIEGLQFVTSLQQLGKAVELFIYPYELHVKAQPKHRYEIYNRNLDWFAFWLQGREDPNPAKKTQYDRWREMRSLGGQSRD